MPKFDRPMRQSVGSPTRNRKARGGWRTNTLAVLLCGVGFLACGDDTTAPATPSVAGTVMADGVGLAGVTVTLQSQLATTTTDANGRFEFFDVAAGTHTLSVAGLPATVYCVDKSFSVNVDNPATTLSQDFGCTENPTMTQLEGSWSYTLTMTTNTCGEIGDPFTSPATLSINTTTATDLDVLFPDPALPITGPYEAATSMFTGMTSGFDLGGGNTSTESWTGEFAFNADNPEMTGVSTVVFTDSEDNEICRGTFDIDGARDVA